MKYSLLKRISAFVLAFALVMTTAFNAVGTTQANAAAAKCSKLAVSAKKATVTVGSSKTITVTQTLTKKAKAKFTVSQKGTGKVTVKKTFATAKKAKGKLKITGSKAGTVTLTVKTKTKKTAKAKAKAVKKTITVTVKAAETTAAATTTEAPTTTQATTQDPKANDAIQSVSLSSNTPKVGDELKATVTFKASSDAATFAWYTVDAATSVATLIDGATTSSLKVTEAMVGKYIKVQATGADSSSAAATTTSVVAAEASAELAITAKQIGASKILITANKAITKEDAITVTRGTAEVKNTFVPSGDGLEVVVTTDAKIGAAEYTVKVTPKDTKKAAATAKFTGVAATLEKIDFVGDELVLTSAKFTECRVKIFGYNNFGEKISLSTLQPYTSKGAVDYSASTNEIVISSTGANVLFQTGESITVTAIYQDGSTVKQVAKALKVSEVSSVKSIVLGELQTSNANLKGKPVNMTNMKTKSYYKTIVAKDQYDNVLTAKNLNDMLNSTENPTGTLFVTGSMAAGSYVYLTGFDNDTAGNVIAKYDLGSIGMPGTQLFTFTAVGGYTTTDSITVVDDPYIASLSITVPELYGGKTAAIEVSAKDSSGDALDLFNYVNKSDSVVGGPGATFDFTDKNNTTKGNTSISIPTGITFTCEKNNTTKTVKFSITPAANPSAANETRVLIVQTAAPTVSNVNCVVQQDPHPYSLSANLKTSGTAKISAKAGTTANLVKEVVVLDQYTSSFGTVTDSAAVVHVDTAVPNKSVQTAAKYAVVVLDKSGAVVANPTALSVAGDYTVNLYYDEDGATPTKDAQLLDSKKFTLYVADEKYSNYAASLKSADKLLFAGAGDDTETIEVTATDSTGEKVTLDYGTDYTMSLEDVPKTTGGAAIFAAAGTNTISVANAQALTTDDTKRDGKMIANIFVGGSVVTTVEVPYSNAAQKTTKYVAKKGTADYDLSNGIEVNSSTAGTYFFDKTANGTVLYIDVDATVPVAGGNLADKKVNAKAAADYTITAVDQYGLSNFDAKFGSGAAWIDGANAPFGDFGDVSLSGTLATRFAITTKNGSYVAVNTRLTGVAALDATNTTSKGAALKAAPAKEIVINGFVLTDQHGNVVKNANVDISGTIALTGSAAATAAAVTTDADGNATITITTGDNSSVDAGDTIAVTYLGKTITCTCAAGVQAWTVA